MDKIENPFLVTLRLPVKISPILLIVSIVLHIICFFLPWMTGLSLYIKLILSCVPVARFFYYFHQYRFCKVKMCVSELVLTSENSWQLKMNNGAMHCAKLGNNLFVHPWLTIISLSFENRREYFIFTPEILDADQFRRLRVRLRFKISE